MNAEMNHLLEQMRTQLKTEGEEAWGPNSDATSSAEGEPGELGAQNENNIWDAFDLYIGDMVDDLTEKYELDDDEALDFIFSVADDLAEEGQLPEIPEGEDEKAVALWLGKAGSFGFERMVLDAAEEEADSEDTED